MTPTDEARRAVDATRILSEPIFKEAWAAYEARLLDELASADRTPQQAEQLRALLIGARKARAHLQRIMQEGEFAAKQVALLDEQRKRRWWERAA